MQGLSGLWGGVGSNLSQAPEGGGSPLLPYEGTTGHTLPMTGGSNWFSSGHYGYEDESTYQFPAGKNLKQIYYRRLQNDAYQWWFIAWERINNNNFTIRYGSKIAVPEGSGNDQEGPFTLNNYTTVGETQLPNDSEQYFVGWHSGVEGDQQVGPPHFVDDTTGGSIGYQQAQTTTPTNNSNITFNYNETGEHFHVHVTWED